MEDGRYGRVGDRYLGASLPMSTFRSRRKRRKLLPPLSSEQRRRHAEEAVELFNARRYWEAHEELEAIWRTVPDEEEALALQGLIQAAAALLHRERGNRHGTVSVGKAALEKLAGPQHPAVEFETQRFFQNLQKAILESGEPPKLTMRT